MAPRWDSRLSADVSEVELVQGCLAGDPDCHRSFVERFQGMIFGVCWRMLGKRQDAEDVAQDVFLRVFRNLTRWDQVRPLRPWLLTITANRCRTHLDERRRHPQPAEFVSEGRPARHTATTIDSEDAEELQLAINTLRPEYRQCFVLFYQQELSVKEVADILDCPEGTVKIWLYRARKEIATWLRKRGFGNALTGESLDSPHTTLPVESRP